jgi:hypothetical protein
MLSGSEASTQEGRWREAQFETYQYLQAQATEKLGEDLTAVKSEKTVPVPSSDENRQG